MDSPRRSRFQPAFTLLVLAILVAAVQGSTVLKVKRRFGAGAGTPAAELHRHDKLRHARRLTARAVDLPLGGSLEMKMWYTEIAVGTPPKRFQVHLDTGSDATIVDCEGCVGCAKSTAEVKMQAYNPELSKTAKIVKADDRLCDEMTKGHPRKNSSSGLCEHDVGYLGDKVGMYFVTDLVSVGQVSSNVTFGCATERTGNDVGGDLRRGVEGLIGLSWGAQSIFYQMAAQGRVRKEFAHCLAHDGGIFGFGRVVKPELTAMPMTPLLPAGGNEYMINVTAIEIDGDTHVPQFPTLLDTGCTVNFLPKAAYEFAMEKILSKHPVEEMQKTEDGVIVHFEGCVDDRFPTITYRVNTSHAIKLYPHDYLVPGGKDVYSIGFGTGKLNLFILGDAALRNKLFVYDLENKQVGWQDYDCSSSIELEDEGGVCNVGAHNITGHPS